jgi:hypothetical protein
MPQALHDKIEAVRRDTGRSFTAEVVARLERTFTEDAVKGSELDALRASLRWLEGRLLTLENKVNGLENPLSNAERLLKL